MFIIHLGKPAAVPLQFVEIESKDSGKEINDGISSFDLFQYCQNISEGVCWNL